jgi:hypothetical protein
MGPSAEERAAELAALRLPGVTDDRREVPLAPLLAMACCAEGAPDPLTGMLRALAHDLAAFTSSTRDGELLSPLAPALEGFTRRVVVAVELRRRERAALAKPPPPDEEPSRGEPPSPQRAETIVNARRKRPRSPSR